MQISRLIRRLALTLAIAAAPAMAQTGVSPNAIVLGHSGDHSGPLKDIGDDYLSGAQLYFDQVNAQGGVHGRSIRIVSLDDGYKADAAEANSRLLIQRDKVFALFGYVGTAPAEAGIRVATENQVPFVAPYSGSASVRVPFNPLVFHFRAPYSAEFQKMAEYLAGLNMTSVAIVHLANDIGTSTAKATETALAARGIKAQQILGIQPNGKDAAQVTDKLVKAAPSAVILLSSGASSTEFMREMLKQDLRPMIFAWSAVGSHGLIRDLREQVHGLVVSQVVPSPFNGEASISREYQQLVRGLSQEPSYGGLEGYMAAKLMAEGLRRAGKDLTREKFISALEGINQWDMGGTNVTLGPSDHGASDLVDLSSISRGRFR